MDRSSMISDQLGDTEFSQSSQISETQKVLCQIHYQSMSIEIHNTTLTYTC